MTRRLIEALAEFDPRIAVGWPGDGRRAARTLVEAIGGAFLGIAAIVAVCFFVLLLAAATGAIPAR